MATAYREIAAGKLATRKVRRATYVHREDLAAYLERARCEQRPGGEAEAPAAPSPRRISLKAAGLIGDDDFGYRPGASKGQGGRKPGPKRAGS